jgi:prepilin-type N-terminal cleavage/methylation domain-containing protein
MKQRKQLIKKGFTLVELLVVISIIAVIIGVTMSNLLGARGRARDAKRKSDLMEMKNALRLFYNDYQNYPASDNSGAGIQIEGCGTPVSPAAPNALCPGFADCSNEFSAGPACASATVYMKQLPRGADGTTIEYQYYQSNAGGSAGDDFCLANAKMENAADQEILASQKKCKTACDNIVGAGIANPAIANPDAYEMCAD